MSKKHMYFWLGIIALAIVGKFFYFWVIIPALLGVVIFYSIQFYKSKNYLVYPAIVFGTLLLCFSAGELYVYKSVPVGYVLDTAGLSAEETYGVNHYADPILGYGTKPMVSKTISRRTIKEELVYDVVYTTDEKGRRITPNNQSTADTLILLFGCSFTVGEGLNDHETFAWQLSELLGPKFQVYNYGFHGYGSHQMLALLESGRLDEFKKKYKNIYGYYLTFPGIEMRSAGLSYWDTTGPRYVLDPANLVRFSGKFSDNKEEIEEIFKFRGKFAQSQLLQNLLDLYAVKEETPSQEYMLDLHEAIIAKSSEVFKNKFSADVFVTVLYRDDDGFKKRITKRELEILELQDYFGDFSKEKYEIPLDGHPNYEANKVMARAYYEDIMKKDASQ